MYQAEEEAAKEHLPKTNNVDQFIFSSLWALNLLCNEDETKNQVGVQQARKDLQISLLWSYTPNTYSVMVKFS